MLSRIERKAFEFSKSFLKPTSSKPLLLLDNRFLGAAPRAFESRAKPNSPILKASQSQLVYCKFKKKLFALNGNFNLKLKGQ
jgi:hypothetical protein